MSVYAMGWVALFSLVCMLACVYAMVATPEFRRDIEAVLGDPQKHFEVKGLNQTRPLIYMVLGYVFMVIFVISLVAILVRLRFY